MNECILKEGITKKINTNYTISGNSTELLSLKSLDAFQEFAYPILSQNLIILYRNEYHGINGNLGVEGNGTFYIYSKNNEEWKLITKITKWIT